MKSNFQANGFHDGNGGDEIETFEIMIHRLYISVNATPIDLDKRPKIVQQMI